MPTIQFRTDDKTKIDSTTLFNQLGITMSEAINMFLRQAVMRGEIPFTLSVPKETEARTKIPGAESLVDAIRRYKTVNGKSDINIAKLDPFLQAIDELEIKIPPRITLQEESVKVRLQYKGKEFIIDYNFDEPDSVFILTRLDGKLMVKDCSLADIAKTLELF